MVATVALIVNPRSHGAASPQSTEAMRLARTAGATIETVGDGASIAAAVRRALAAGASRLVVLGGDGTLQAVVDELAPRCGAAGPVPDVLVLPAGRSNLTALDLLPARRAVAVLRRALDAGATLHTEPRPTLVVEQRPAPPRHGFFLAGALVDGVIRRIHAERAAAGRRRGFASTVSGIARFALPALVGRSPLAVPTLSIDAGPLGRVDGPVRWLLATTLRHEHGAFDPYPERGDGPLRVAAVARDAPAQARRLPFWLAGHWSAAMDAARGWLGGRTERLTITGLRGYTLDGESHDVDASRPLVVRGGPALRFVVG